MTSIDKRTRAEIGRSSRRKGIEAEQAVARYLATHGWPAAKRKVRTGWKVGDKVARDCGDIADTPGICWQVKNASTDLTDNGIRKTLAEAADQAVEAGDDLGVVIERRAGKSDPGNWWAWLTVRDLAALLDTAWVRVRRVRPEAELDTPVRQRLGDLVSLLHLAGYGTSHNGQESA